MLVHFVVVLGCQSQSQATLKGGCPVKRKYMMAPNE